MPAQQITATKPMISLIGESFSHLGACAMFVLNAKEMVHSIQSGYLLI